MSDAHRARLTKQIAIVAAWIVALVMFFPIFWMVLTSFKTELQAISVPPKLVFTPTLENYGLVEERTDYLRYAWSS
ncbi:MAG: carbohydrate ABC transporter permease, partial [Pseudomonadota bacterium]